MKKEYISIKEFAEVVGISQQAVYKQLNNKLKPYLKVVENKKMLDKSAVELFKNDRKSQQNEQQLNNKLIEMLQTELDRKNEQIAELQKLLDQSQKLHAMDKQRLLELECKAEEPMEQEEPQKKKWWNIFG